MQNLFKKRTNISAIQEQLKNLEGKSGFEQQELKEWKITLDKSGEGSAVLRFLPSDEEHGNPFIKVINHGFQIGNKWYINNCPTTHGNTDENFAACPVCSYINEKNLYETDNAAYGLMKRKTSFWAKVKVIKDPSNRDNEGEIFLYRFGVKIMQKITGMINVDEALGETPVDVSCPVSGANFILKCTRVSNQRNYDQSSFQAPSPIAGIFNKDGSDNEAAQAKLAEAMAEISLGDLIADSNFKTKAELEKQFARVMGTEQSQTAAKIDDELSDFEEEMNSFDNIETKSVSKDKTTKTVDDELDDILG